MKLKTGLIIGLLVLLVAAAGSALYLSSAQQNTGIIVTTNGTEVTIQSTSWFDVPEAMLDEMKVKALEDVQDPDSTVDSIKTDMQNIATKYNYTVQVKISSQFGEDQLPMPATVKGTSMIPTLQDGQDIIVLKTTDFKVGDIVVAHHPDYNLIVKRVAAINGSQVYLKSDNRQVEISSQIQQVNGVQQVVTIKKTPLDTWLPASNVVGVVKIY
ncbi:S24/S26 family peptidase [Methanobacterium ferruginis]|uniref:S24/S26 family peptidase n=1 Tax=Methanobacterium ferruginis TaxID=710191 RepID=UPI002573E6F5|nr:S24/S26 family peptidase [Methanobacterium ferruginis]BDZ69301.1 phage repressor protein [Methanobacterium ferruginis]